MPVQVDVTPCRWGNLLEHSECFRVTNRLIFREQPREDGGVAIDDHVADQSPALVADLDFDVGSASQLLLTAHLGNG